jgi:hypothetical protein
MDQRIRNPGRLFITSSVLTSDACMQALRARDAAKAPPSQAKVRRKQARAALLVDDPDCQNFPVDDGPMLDAWAVVVDRALPPDPEVELVCTLPPPSCG